MACFGARELYLVRPKAPLRETMAHWACHGLPVLENRVVVDDLQDALRGTTLSIATSGMHGKRRYRMVTPAQLVSDVLPMFEPGKIALVFGGEESGLDGATLEKCQRIVKIPTQPDHFSVNLAHSVTIMLYELVGRLAETELGGRGRKLAPPEQRERMMLEFGKFMAETGYPSHVATLEGEMAKLGDIAERAQLEEWEIRFLLGMVRHLRNYYADRQGNLG